ncbi:MAG: hypothetical protein P8078_00790, partial [bacterium]
MKKIFIFYILGLLILSFACQKILDPIIVTSGRSISIIKPKDIKLLDPENVRLDWDCPDAISYSVYLDTIPSPLTKIKNKISRSSLQVYGLQYNKDYYWRIIAFFQNGDSATSKINHFKTISFDPFSSISLLYIDFPKAELSLYRTISDDYPEPPKEDTLVQKVVFSKNPVDYVDVESFCYVSVDSNEYKIIENKVFFYMWLIESCSDGGDSWSYRTNIKGQLEIDTLSNKISMEINFNYKYKSYYAGGGGASNSNTVIWISEIHLENIPYKINKCLEFSIESSNMEDYLKHFSYTYEKSSSSDLDPMGTLVKEVMLSLIGFE